MPSIRYKMVRTLFKVIGVNKMLDKQGEDFKKLLAEFVPEAKTVRKEYFNALT